MQSELKDKVALITGASTGIGAAVARGYAALGCKVVIHYNASEDKAKALADDITRLGGTAMTVRGDVTDREQVRRIVAETMAAMGRIDILVNNAGALVQRRRIEEYSDDYLEQVLAVNVKQVVWFMADVVPVMRAQGGGAIVNVSSIAARNGGAGGSVVYAAAKAFVATATRGWARELAKDHIRVNAVSPGVIATPFHDRFSTPEQLKVMQASIPMDRIGTPDECVGSFVFLASDAMSSYVTGQVLEVNGGQYMP